LKLEPFCIFFFKVPLHLFNIISKFSICLQKISDGVNTMNKPLSRRIHFIFILFKIKIGHGSSVTWLTAIECFVWRIAPTSHIIRRIHTRYWWYEVICSIEIRKSTIICLSYLYIEMIDVSDFIIAFFESSSTFIIEFSLFFKLLFLLVELLLHSILSFIVLFCQPSHFIFQILYLRLFFFTKLSQELNVIVCLSQLHF